MDTRPKEESRCDRPGHVIRLARGNVAWLQASSEGRNYGQTRFRRGIFSRILGLRRTPQRGRVGRNREMSVGGSEVAENFNDFRLPQIFAV
jgi:hypothetical protein